MFNEFLKGYDWWGYCDIDVIFGDLNKFIAVEILNKYTRVLCRGHLTMYRNMEEVNNYFRLYHPSISYKDVFANKKTVGFDEWNGIFKILQFNKIPQFHDEFIANIVPERRKLTLTIQERNYRYQFFVYDRGKIYQYFITQSEIKKREFAYIHLQKRNYKPHKLSRDCERFVIKEDEFIEFDDNKINEYFNYRYSFRDVVYPWQKKMRQLKRKIRNWWSGS
ncbi:hypothetical protein CaldiYA01_03230 [Caldicellulosiruptor diazotrophicus]|uniref:Glycosyltransferase n=1 Tax=Caldicellulosiruptor diazotrophicus TaxID=2806205 RepID=A0ABN6E4R8_9FIRM|nr:hypothetical protein CaldiYA01_03230 [Caldicellulosiruptor diazotrophicus]